MKAYLLEKYSDMKNAYTANRLKKEAEKRGIDFEIVGERDIEIHDGAFYMVGGNPALQILYWGQLQKADFCLLRSKEEIILKQIAGLAERFINPLDKYIRFLDKGEEIKALQDSSVPMPELIMPFSIEDKITEYKKELGNLPGCFNEGESYFIDDMIEEIYSFVKGRLGSPFVMKGLKSSMGKEIFLIKDFDAFKCIIEKFPLNKPFLNEEFVEGGNRDVRLFILNGEIIAAMERENRNDFRSNVALGSSVRKVEVTDEMRSIANIVYKRTGLDVIGLDLLHGKDGLLFCELNVMPGLQGIEEASGKNIAGEIIDFAIKCQK